MVDGFSHTVRQLAGIFYRSTLKFSNILCSSFMEENDDDEQEEEREAGDNLAQEEKSGDKDSDNTSVNEEVTEPCEQVKRAVIHYMYYIALTTHSCFL